MFQKLYRKKMEDKKCNFLKIFYSIKSYKTFFKLKKIALDKK